jgi:uncharacterized protein (TIGR01244 family)
MRSMWWLAAVAALAAIPAGAALAQQVNKEQIAGVRNLARIETTVACAGATSADAVPEIKKMGFVSIINLRVADEPGADVEKEELAAKAAGLRYFHVPFAGKPDPKAAEAFLNAITTKGAEPAYIHCAGGNRAATMWLIKRIAVDHWDVDKAVAEATALGQTSVPLREFAIDYGKTHPR